MRNHLAHPVACVLLLATAAPLTSCASHGIAPDPVRGLSVLVVPFVDREVSARLFELDGDLHVHGSVRARRARAAKPGMLAVVVREPGGKEWDSERVNYQLRFRRGPRGGSSKSVFDVIFDGIPPAGSTVMLRHHEEPHSGG